jgi:hypothetical protein
MRRTPSLGPPAAINSATGRPAVSSPPPGPSSGPGPGPSSGPSSGPGPGPVPGSTPTVGTPPMTFLARGPIIWHCYTLNVEKNNHAASRGVLKVPEPDSALGKARLAIVSRHPGRGTSLNSKDLRSLLVNVQQFCFLLGNRPITK